MERTLVYSREYLEFEQNSSPRVKEKLRYATVILETIYPIPAKFVKKLTNTDFHELRISAEQEIRVILFAVINSVAASIRADISVFVTAPSRLTFTV